MDITVCVFCQVLAVMYHDVDNTSSQNAGIVIYRNIKDTVRTHFAETNGAGAFLEAPLQAYYGLSTRNVITLVLLLLNMCIFVVTVCISHLGCFCD